MVEVVEELVELTPGFKAFLFGNLSVVRFLKIRSKSSEHFSDGKIVLVMSVETGRIEDSRNLSYLPNITAPQVAVEKGGKNINVGEEGRHPRLQRRPETHQLRVCL